MLIYFCQFSQTPGLFIRSIQPNSIVAEDGKIKVGDQLMKVA
jgi:hypothetical protein